MSTDTHTTKYGQEVSHTRDTEHETIDGTYDAEAIKVTHCEGLELAHKHAIGGREDCLDVVRSTGLLFRDAVLWASSGTRTFITAKGGGNHEFRDILLIGRTRWPWDISLGDWTLYNANPEHPPMREVVLDNVRRKDGRRLVVLQLYCDNVTVRNCKATVINLRWLAPTLFRLHRTLRKPDPRVFAPVPAFLFQR